MSYQKHGGQGVRANKVVSPDSMIKVSDPAKHPGREYAELVTTITK